MRRRRGPWSAARARSRGGRRAPAGRESARSATRCGAHGGTTFGPQPRSYDYQLPKKVEKGALRAALTQKLRDGAVIVVDALSVGEIKTKAAAEMLKRLGVDGKALLVDVKPEEKLALSVRNIDGVRMLPSNRVSARDVMDTRRVVADARRRSRSCQEASAADEDSLRRHPAAAHHREDHASSARTAGRWCSRWRRTRTRSTSSAPSRSCSARRSQSVRTSLAHGKMKRQGKYIGRRSDWKKAYVKLRDGEKLPEFLRGRRKTTMPIRKYNPTSPGVSGKTSLTFDEITTSEPHRPLTENLHRSGGRNNQGGDHHPLPRRRPQADVSDHRFKRTRRTSFPTIDSIEYDPNRSARIALISTPTAKSGTSCPRRA